MMKISSFIQMFLLITGVLSVLPSPYAVSQESAGPLPPPVDIEISTVGIPVVGEELELRIKVTPLEEMHADISCLLPLGVTPVREEGIMLRPYTQRGMYPQDIERQMEYTEAVGLWVGPMEGNITKEFSFRVVIPEKKRYEFIVIVEALAKWGAKEKVFAIEPN